MNSGVLRPYTTELTYQVFDWPVHPELVESLAREELAREGYRLVFHLTPAGHLMEWHWGEVVLVEMLADQAHPLPEHRQLFGHRVGNERSEQFQPAESVSYQTCFQVERLAPELFLHLHDELMADGEKQGILHLLPCHDRLGLSPISFVDLQSRPGSLLAHIYHTFPDEFAVVKTQTLIEVSGEQAA
ncbi:hypothetical protein Pan216_31670 [Planctomycetes bacterium Pan216]|uniref:DUF2617 domain-containing protein n=1 Tax=Kolteria novifilia TaxID=2527975 RepID=A0A518B5P4_9BACT|nr:hypothetical protein Pan216_31670 [Planctomycetes bacterium Pan216]